MMRTQGGREAHHEGQHKEWSQEGETALDTADHSVHESEAANPGGQQVLYDLLYGNAGQACLLCHVWHTE